MSSIESWRGLTGTWNGTSQLFLPGDPTRASASTAAIDEIARGKFSRLTYTWEFDGEPQEGQLVLGYDQDGGGVDGVFIDSWHMGDKMMLLRGKIVGGSSVDLLGSYAVEGSPDWGWRMVIEASGGGWRLLMYNVSPDGEETLGVEATYVEKEA